MNTACGERECLEKSAPLKSPPQCALGRPLWRQGNTEGAVPAVCGQPPHTSISSHIDFFIFNIYLFGCAWSCGIQDLQSPLWHSGSLVVAWEI